MGAAVIIAAMAAFLALCAVVGLTAGLAGLVDALVRNLLTAARKSRAHGS